MAENKLWTCIWRQNSPYGSYVAGDVVSVYWNDVTDAFSVYKNGSVITSSTGTIPVTFVSSGLSNYYYKDERIEEVLICVGTSKLKYTRKSDFPYLVDSYYDNHPSCGVPLVCDIEFDSLPIVTNASTSTSSDGAIVVSATSSYGPIEYKLNADFAYGYGQSSSTFSSLAQGDYTIYARDSKNCRAVLTTKVGTSKVYGTKYRFEFESLDGKTHRTEILQKDYAGSITDVNGAVPATIYSLRGEGNRDKFTPIISSEIETNFISETEGYFQEIFTNNPEKYRLYHYINNSLVWVGKVLSNQYEEVYINPPYPVKILATDSLPKLNDIPFLDEYGNKLSGDLSQITIIAFILEKLGFDLNIRSACNIYASTMSTSASDDPLDQAYVDVDRYYYLKQEPSCMDVLKWILDPYNAQLIQWDGKWNIIRVEERISDFDYREYDHNGQYISNGTITSIINLDNITASNKMTWASRNQVLRIMPGYGSIQVNYNLGSKKNILKNGDFRLTSRLKYDLVLNETSDVLVPDLNGFQVVNTNNDIIYIGYEKLADRNIAVVFTSKSPNGNSYLLSQTYNIKMGTKDKLRFSIRFKIVRSANADTTQLYDFKYAKVKAQVKYGDYYLTNNGIFYLYPYTLTYYLEGDKQNQYVDWIIVANTPAESIEYLNGKNFNIQLFFPNTNDAEFVGATTADAIQNLRDFPTIGLPVGYKTELYDISNTYGTSGLIGPYICYYVLEEDSNAESLPDIVRPTDYNASTNAKQWILKAIQLYDEAFTTSFFVDKISVEILSDGKEAPEFENLTKSLEIDNDEILNKEIVHGSLINNGQTNLNFLSQINFSGINIGFGIDIFTGSVTTNTNANLYNFVVNSSDVTYNGYLKNSSNVGYSVWSRVGYTENLSLQEIYMNSYSSQYNQSWRMLTGDMVSNDTFFSPLNALKETMDNDRIYIPSSLQINFASNTYSCEFMELLNYTINSSNGFTEGFTIGFNS